MHLLAPHACDGQPQAVPVYEAPQEAPDMPDDFPHAIWSSRLPINIQAAQGQLGHCGQLCRPHLKGRTPADASERWSTPDSTALLQGIKGLSRQVAALSAEQDSLHTSTRDSCSGSRSRRAGSRFPSKAAIIAAMEPGRKSVLSLAPTASRGTNTADITDSTCLGCNDRPPIHYE
jgi:hypothetical protein